MSKPKYAHQRPIAKAMRKRGWSYKTPSNGLRRRIYSIVTNRQPWWDWGNRVIALTGTDFGGSWDSPQPPTWWYRQDSTKRMARTGYPIHPPSTYEVITDYDEFRKRTEGCNEDAMYEWQAICVDQDGQLQLGHRYWGKDFYGLNRWDVPILRRYLRMAHRHDWYGLRSWLYSQALYAAVHKRKPGACQQVPPRGSGGYDHWHCTEPKGHVGLHRFGAMTWGDIDGEPLPVTHVPQGADS